ncbi:MAG: adenosylmethionine decarboxylase [Candidatus Muiribacteriota bacterium]|jgi:S-adenosylmethionine decarboxylase proenzyme
MEALGYHVMLELFDCDRDVLNDRDRIEEHMLMAAKKSGATIIQTAFHQFNPQGVSGVVVIAESHLAIHTWPEFGYAAVDVFTCGNTVDTFTAYRYLKEKFGAQIVKTYELKRGELFQKNLVSKTQDLHIERLDFEERNEEGELENA